MGDDGNAPQSSGDTTLRRRHLLSALAAAGLAGCPGGGGDGSDGGDGGSDGGTVEASVPSEWPSVDDDYYSGLVSELSGEMGLAPGRFLYADNEADALSAYTLTGDAAEQSELDVGDDVPFSSGLRVDVTEETENTWDVTFNGTVQDQGVVEGDVLLGVVYLRGPEESESTPTAQYVSKDEDNLSTNMVGSQPQVAPGPEWERYYFPIQFDYTSEPGTWWTEIFMGFGVQSVDVGGVALLYFGDNVAVEDLPSGPASGGGGGPAEDWEAAADERIAQHRTADLTVEVTDADGNAVEGTDVSVAMQEHDFGFGTAIGADYLVNETEAGDPYRENVADLFNTTVLGNYHKWRFWEESEETADAATEWLLDQGMTMRGHVCLWSAIDSWAVPPDVVRAMGVEWADNGVTDPELDPEYVRQRTMDHIPAIIGDYGEDIDEWEVANEVIHQPGFVKAINGVRATESTTLEEVDPVEAPILGEWYDTAREAAPDSVSLAMNDYNTLAGPYPATRDEYERQVEFLTDHSLDAVGMQCHFSQSETLTPAQIMEGLDRYASHDVRLRVTEFDMADDGWAEEDKATFFRQFLKTVFSHPAVDDFVVWGIWDPNHWLDDAPFFTEDWSEKPALEEYRSLVFDEWWTEESGTTDGDGVTETVRLGDDGTTVELSPA
jgi:GH35 family endo-1,4-beta-xylanase